MVVYESLISFLLPHEIYIIKILNIFAVKKKRKGMLRCHKLQKMMTLGKNVKLRASEHCLFFPHATLLKDIVAEKNI